MAKRYTGNMSGERYLVNTSANEVHDLDNEKSQCLIDEVINAGYDKPYNYITAAHDDGYRNCTFCIGSFGLDDMMELNISA